MGGVDWTAGFSSALAERSMASNVELGMVERLMYKDLFDKKYESTIAKADRGVVVCFISASAMSNSLYREHGFYEMWGRAEGYGRQCEFGAQYDFTNADSGVRVRNLLAAMSHLIRKFDT